LDPLLFSTGPVPFGAGFVFWVFGFRFLLWAGIREFVSVLHALPLCGAAPTFLCSGKEK
jgi:hypothetical protein